MRGDLAKATGLVATMQKLATQYRDKGLDAWVVYLGGPESKTALEKFVAENKVTIMVALLPNGQAPPAYKIAPEAETTVLVHKRNSVLANFVNPTKDELAKIAATVDEMMK